MHTIAEAPHRILCSRLSARTDPKSFKTTSQSRSRWTRNSNGVSLEIEIDIHINIDIIIDNDIVIDNNININIGVDIATDLVPARHVLLYKGRKLRWNGRRSGEWRVARG